MKKQKTPKALRAPEWNDPLSKKQIIAADRRYGTLAGTYVSLASIIEQADIALSNADNIPQGSNAVEIQQNEGPLFAIDDIGGENRDLVMKQSLLTYLPVMCALYSTVKLKQKIEDATGIKDAARFYYNLKVALRYYGKYKPDGGYSMSGDESRTPGTKERKFLGTHYLGPLMHVRWGGPTARDLIALVYRWAIMENANSRKKGVPIKSGNQPSPEARALAVYADNPDLSATDIAKKAGVHRTALYRMEKFKKAKAIYSKAQSNSHRNAKPRGTKDGKTGDVEAWHE